MMKVNKIQFLFAVCLFISSVVYAQSIDSSLQKVKLLYDNQQYDSVISLYTSTIEKGYVSDKIYFNVANAYFKQRDIAHAILYYERALVVNPYNEDCRNNLAIAQAMQPDKVEHIQESVLQLWYPYVYRLFDSNTWAVLSILLFAISIAFVLWFLFTKVRLYKKIAFFVALSCLFISVFSYVNAKNRYHDFTHNPFAIIMEPTVSIKTEPNDLAKDLVVVHGGLRVRIEKVSGNWVSIRLQDGKVGWVLSDTVQKI